MKKTPKNINKNDQQLDGIMIVLFRKAIHVVVLSVNVAIHVVILSVNVVRASQHNYSEFRTIIKR